LGVAAGRDVRDEQEVGGLDLLTVGLAFVG
jgi:hypothetical protein